MSAWLTFRAWGEFLLMDLASLCGFRATHRMVTMTRTRNHATSASLVVDDVINAVSTASLFYFKQAYCLQRSAVVTRLLRQHGVSAELIVGYRQPPLEAHAWVEVSGRIVSDMRDDIEHFIVLDRW